MFNVNLTGAVFAVSTVEKLNSVTCRSTGHEWLALCDHELNIVSNDTQETTLLELLQCRATYHFLHLFKTTSQILWMEVSFHMKIFQYFFIFLNKLGKYKDNSILVVTELQLATVIDALLQFVILSYFHKEVDVNRPFMVDRLSLDNIQ